MKDYEQAVIVVAALTEIYKGRNFEPDVKEKLDYFLEILENNLDKLDWMINSKCRCIYFTMLKDYQCFHCEQEDE